MKREGRKGGEKKGGIGERFSREWQDKRDIATLYRLRLKEGAQRIPEGNMGGRGQGQNVKRDGKEGNP